MSSNECKSDPVGKRIRKSMERREFDVLIDVIKQAREESGVSQRAVARDMGLMETVYGRIERGERVLDVIEFTDIANAIGMDPVALYERFVKASKS